MSTVTKKIEVDVPVREAYGQFTRFEEFPKFMDGVETVEQLDDTHLHWKAEIAGKTKEWDAEILVQEPDQRIEWRNYDGAGNKGIVRFDPIEGRADATRVTMLMEIEPEGAIEGIGDMLGFTDRRIKGDLDNFKEYVEKHGGDSGWRGKVRQGETTG